MLSGMPMSEQVAVRLDVEQLHELDSLVRSGVYENRADAVRAAIAMALQEHKRLVIAAAYRRGYTAHPQLGDDLEWVEMVGRRNLLETE
jgi:Arc/MetJ-type ribon-helix-helix transcriptional regulator